MGEHDYIYPIFSIRRTKKYWSRVRVDSEMHRGYSHHWEYLKQHPTASIKDPWPKSKLFRHHSALLVRYPSCCLECTFMSLFYLSCDFQCIDDNLHTRFNIHIKRVVLWEYYVVIGTRNHFWLQNDASCTVSNLYVRCTPIFGIKPIRRVCLVEIGDYNIQVLNTNLHHLRLSRWPSNYKM